MEIGACLRGSRGFIEDGVALFPLAMKGFVVNLAGAVGFVKLEGYCYCFGGLTDLSFFSQSYCSSCCFSFYTPGVSYWFAFCSSIGL